MFLFPVLIREEKNFSRKATLITFYCVIRWVASKRLNNEVIETLRTTLTVLGKAFDEFYGDEDFTQMKSHVSFFFFKKFELILTL